MCCGRNELTGKFGIARIDRENSPFQKTRLRKCHAVLPNCELKQFTLRIEFLICKASERHNQKQEKEDWLNHRIPPDRFVRLMTNMSRSVSLVPYFAKGSRPVSHHSPSILEIEETWTITKDSAVGLSVCSGNLLVFAIINIKTRGLIFVWR